MDALLELRAGAQLGAVGLPMTRAPDGRVRVSAPNLNEQQITRYLIARLPGALVSLETISSATSLAGCNCIGRRR